MQITHPTDVARREVGELREGSLDNRVLLTGTEGSSNNYRLQLGLAETDWLTPRHRHNFDQIRYPIRGEIQYAENKVLPAGWVGYFPEGTYYGPQIRKQGLYMLLCQFGGASGNGFMSEKQRKAGFESLRGKGRIEKGAFFYTDDQGAEQKQDAFEAAWEKALNRKVDYPSPRYPEVIVMNPENYNWVASPDTPGVEFKWLGAFTERLTRIGFIRLEKGAKYIAGICRAPEWIFVTKGALSCQERSCPVDTALGFEGMEGPIEVRASEPSEAFLVQMEK